MVPELPAASIIELAASRRNTHRNNNSMVLVVEPRWKLLLFMLLVIAAAAAVDAERERGRKLLCFVCFVFFFFTGVKPGKPERKVCCGTTPVLCFLPMNIIVDRIYHAALVLWVYATYAQLSLTSCAKGHPPFRFLGAEWEEEDGTGRSVITPTILQGSPLPVGKVFPLSAGKACACLQAGLALAYRQGLLPLSADMLLRAELCDTNVRIYPPRFFVRARAFHFAV